MAGTKTKEPKRGRRPKQKLLDEMEAERIRDVEEAADEYVYVRDTRMDWTKREIAAQQKLLELMHQHKLTVYEAADYTVKVDLATTEKVKVKTKKPDTGEGE